MIEVEPGLKIYPREVEQIRAQRERLGITKAQLEERRQESLRRPF